MKLFDNLLKRLLDLAPQIGLVFMIVVVGLIAAVIARRIVRFLVSESGLEAAMERAGVSKALYKLGSKQSASAACGKVAFWIVILITFAGIAEYVGMPGLASAAGTVMSYLPRLLMACAILAGGFWIASTLKAFLSRLDPEKTGLDSPSVFAQVVYYAIAVIAVVLAAEQAGVKTELVGGLLKLVVGAFVVALALGFALGSKRFFESLLTRHHYERLIQIGDIVRVGDDEGRVLAFSRTALVIAGKDDQVIIPASELSEQRVRLLDGFSEPTPESE